MLWKDAAKYTAGHKVGHTWLAVATVLAIIASTSMIHVEAQQTGMTDQAVTEDHVRSRRALSSQQRVHLEARIAKAHAIVGRIAGDAKRRGAGPGWRQATLESLLPLSLDALEQLEQRVLTADTLPRAVMEVREDPNLLGDPNTDLIYRPINPCRFIDTRSVGGKVDGVVGYDLAANGAIYGGTAACAPKTVFGVASEDQIAAIAMNVTIVDPSAAPGFLTVKPSAP